MNPKSLTYNQFIKMFENLSVSIVLPNDNVMSISEWKENLILYCGEEILNRYMCGCQIKLEFNF